MSNAIENTNRMSSGSRLMNTARANVLFLWLVLLSASLAAQRTWTVDMLQRPGTDFTDLPQAVAAASSGDIIRLRGTTPTTPCNSWPFCYPIVDAYVAPTIQGKALTIVGDRQLPRPRVTRGWDIHGLLEDQVVTLEYLDLHGRPVINGQFNYIKIYATNNAGAIVLDEVVVYPSYQETGGYNFLYGTRFIDCSLVVIRNSSINTDGGPWIALRSTIMISGSVVENTPHIGVRGPGAIFAQDSRLHIANSSIVGAYAIPGTWPSPSPQPVGTSAIVTCGSEITVSGNSRLEAGLDLVSRLAPIDGYCFINSGPSYCHIDPSTTTIGPMIARSYLIFDYNPQTGLSCTLTPTTMTVDHYTMPHSLSVLAIGDLQTTPWSHVVGPVFVNPLGAVDYFDIVPSTTSGPLRRTFAVPPALPVGTQVALQAFELQGGGAVKTSNATVIGIW